MSARALAAGRRERTKAANRAAILAAARDVFAELGYGAASVRDIVRRTDLAGGTFYNYFPDKESVLPRARRREPARGARAACRGARRARTTLEEFVERRLPRVLRLHRRGPADVRAHCAATPGTIRTLFDEPVLGAGTRRAAADLRAAIERGDMPPFDTEYMTAAMAGVALEVGIRMIERDPPDVDGAAAFATAVFLGGIERLGRSAR